MFGVQRIAVAVAIGNNRVPVFVLLVSALIRWCTEHRAGAAVLNERGIG